MRGAVHSCVEEERGALFDSGSLRLPGHDAQRNPLTDRVAVTGEHVIRSVQVGRPRCRLESPRRLSTASLWSPLVAK